jgi:hypothetical protein
LGEKFITDVGRGYAAKDLRLSIVMGIPEKMDGLFQRKSQTKME